MANGYDRKDYETASRAFPGQEGPAEARTPGKRTRAEALGRSGSIASLAEQVAAYLRQGSGGASLPGDLQGSFGASLGADVTDVRVHTDDGAARAAKSVGARAFTVGRDIYFGAGQYDPGSTGGRELIAHEVAHTAQQGRGAQFKLEVSAPGDAAELEADQAAAAMVRGEPARVSPASGAIHRAPERVTHPDEQRIPGYTPYDEVEEEGDKVHWRERAVDAEGNTTIDEERSGLNVYSEAARSKGWTPNPADPYGATDDEIAAVDWSASELMGPDNPGAWSVSFAPKQPLPVQKTGKDPRSGEARRETIPVQAAQCAIAQSAVNAFQAPYEQAKGSWEAMSPNVQAFHEAGKNAHFQEGGLNWLPSKDAVKAHRHENLADLAEGQGVGHKGKGPATHTVKDVANLTDKQLEGLKGTEAQKKACQTKAGEVASKVTAMETAYKNEGLAMQAHGVAVAALGTARSSVSLENLTDKKDEEVEHIDSLKAKKAELEKNVDDVVKYYGWGKKLLEGPIGAANIVMEGYKDLALAGYKQALTADYDAKIRAGAQRVKSLASEMKSLNSKINSEHVTQAAETVIIAAGKMTSAKSTIFEKLVDVETKQREFAEQAAAQVGGEKGDLLRAALEALPKVALVVRYCEAAANVISVPGFTHEAGRGMLGAAQTPQAFVRHCGEMTGYKTYFDVQLDHWRPILENLQALAKSYGLGD